MAKKVRVEECPSCGRRHFLMDDNLVCPKTGDDISAAETFPAYKQN